MSRIRLEEESGTRRRLGGREKRALQRGRFDRGSGQLARAHSFVMRFPRRETPFVGPVTPLGVDSEAV